MSERVESSLSSAAKPGRLVIAARIACFAFAVVLWGSAILKAIGPSYAASAVAWTGLDLDARLQLVDVSVVLEACLAALLLAWAPIRAMHVLGAAAAGLLLVVHVIGWVQGRGPCGCFGELVVPNGVTLAALLIGGSGCVVLARRASRPPWRGTTWRGTTWRILASIVVIATTVAPFFQRSQTAMLERFYDHAALPASVDEALFVIGAFECAPCHDELDRVARKRARSARARELQIHFVTPRGSSFDPEVAARFPWLHHLRIPEDLWRRLTYRGSPCFVHFRRGQPLVVDTDWHVDPAPVAPR